MKKDEIVKYNNIKYKVIKFLGKGSYKSAYLCERIDNKELFVVFEQISESERDTEAFNYEIDKLNKIMKKFKKKCVKNIICPIFLRKKTRNKKGVIITNYFKGRDLFQFLYEDDTKYSLVDVITIMKNIIDTLSKLHNLNIVHMDLKPENIMINPETFEIYIIDLGLSCETDDKSCDLLGTPIYTPPEIYSFQKRNRIPNSEILFKFDIWALGCIFFEILVKKQLIPYILHKSDPTFNDIYNLMFSIDSPKINFVDKIKNSINIIHYNKNYTNKESDVNNIIVNQLISIVLGCLQTRNYYQRYSINELMDKIDKLELLIQQTPKNKLLNEKF